MEKQKDKKIDHGLYTRINRYDKTEYIGKLRPSGGAPSERNLTKKDKADNISKARVALQKWREFLESHSDIHHEIDAKSARGMKLDDFFNNYFLPEQSNLMQKEYSKIYRSHLKNKFGYRIMQTILKTEVQEHLLNIIEKGRQVRIKEPGNRRKYIKKAVPEYLYETKDKDGNIIKKIRDWDYVYKRKAFADRTIIYITQVVGITWGLAISKGVVITDIGQNILKLKDEKGEDVKLRAKQKNITHIVNIDLLLAIREIYKTTIEVEKNIKFQIAMLFGIFTGRREIEILSLRWEDVDLVENFIMPRVQTVKENYHTKYYIPKVIQDHLKTLKKTYPSDIYIFQSDKKSLIKKGKIQPYGATALIEHFKIIVNKVYGELRIKNGNELTFHDLRHFQASILAGYVEDRIIDRILEHRTGKIIDNYSNYEIKKIQIALEAYEKCVLGNGDCASIQSKDTDIALRIKEKELQLRELELLIEAKKLGIDI